MLTIQQTRSYFLGGSHIRSDSPHTTSVQYCGGCSVHRGDNISTVGDSFSTVGGSFSTVEVVQYSGGIASVLWGDGFSTVGDKSVLWGINQYCGGIPSVLWGITAVHVGDNSSTCGG